MTEKERVAEHLNTLSILHYVYAALLSVGMCFGGFYIGMASVFTAAVKSKPNAPPGAEMVGGVMAVFGTIVVLIALTGAICCFLSGRFLKQRRHRTFSQVVAGLCCVHIPLGTALGVFTFIALAKPEAQELYGDAAGDGLPPPA